MAGVNHEALKLKLKELGIDPKECGLVRPRNLRDLKRRHKLLDVDLSECGFRGDDDLVLVHYEKPAPPAPPAPEAPKKRRLFRGKE